MKNYSMRGAGMLGMMLALVGSMDSSNEFYSNDGTVTNKGLYRTPDKPKPKPKGASKTKKRRRR